MNSLNVKREGNSFVISEKLSFRQRLAKRLFNEPIYSLKVTVEPHKYTPDVLFGYTEKDGDYKIVNFKLGT